MESIKRVLPELKLIEAFAKKHSDIVELETLGSINDGPNSYPVHALKIGPNDKSLPTFCITGGVHGLERIGSQVVLSYLNVLDQRLKWDADFREQLKTRRVLSIPMVNPWGVANKRRSNQNGVDLMRNAPVDAERATWLVGGHRHSPKLPWYRGAKGEKLEKENQLLVDFLLRETRETPITIALDMHSGFGLKDQIWYPFAYSNKVDFPHLNEFRNLKKLFEDTYPHHVYKIEPQSAIYTTHGDIWDYLILEKSKRQDAGIFIPITLELGSWNWVKKNPIQIFSLFGHFNPIKAHRYSRVMRRHVYLYDFLFRAVKNYESWTSKVDK